MRTPSTQPRLVSSSADTHRLSSAALALSATALTSVALLLGRTSDPKQGAEAHQKTVHRAPDYSRFVDDGTHSDFTTLPDQEVQLGTTIYVRTKLMQQGVEKTLMVPMTFSVDGKTLTVGMKDFRQISETDGQLVTVKEVCKEGECLSVKGKALLRGTSTLSADTLSSVAAALLEGRAATIDTNVFILGTFSVRIESADLPLIAAEQQ